MRYAADTGEATEQISGGGFTPVPEGIYDAEITEVGHKETKAGDPMHSLRLVIITGPMRDRLLFDNIVIPRVGSASFKIMGRTMHFLHMINQPYQGQFVVDTDKWVHQIVKVKVKHEIQKEGKYAGKPKAVIADYLSTKDSPLSVDPEAEPESDPDVPF